MIYNATGKIYKLFDAQRINDKLTKREFVLEIQDGQFPQLVKFETMNDKCELLDRFNVGDTVTVRFNLRGREWTNPKGETLYFNTLSVYEVYASDEVRETLSAKTRFEARDVDKAYAQEKKSDTSSYSPSKVDELEESDDLPF